jgi:hypothetical protein
MKGSSPRDPSLTPIWIKTSITYFFLALLTCEKLKRYIVPKYIEV